MAPACSGHHDGTGEKGGVWRVAGRWRKRWLLTVSKPSRHVEAPLNKQTAVGGGATPANSEQVPPHQRPSGPNPELLLATEPNGPLELGLHVLHHPPLLEEDESKGRRCGRAPRHVSARLAVGTAATPPTPPGVHPRCLSDRWGVCDWAPAGTFHQKQPSESSNPAEGEKRRRG